MCSRFHHLDVMWWQCYFYLKTVDVIQGVGKHGDYQRDIIESIHDWWDFFLLNVLFEIIVYIFDVQANYLWEGIKTNSRLVSNPHPWIFLILWMPLQYHYCHMILFFAWWRVYQKMICVIL